MSRLLTWITDRLLLLPLLLLPHHRLSRLIHRLARIEQPTVAQWLIRSAIRIYQIDLSTAVETDPSRYPSFNHFFTRALRDDARPLASGEEWLLSPVDGQISQCGAIDCHTLFQAKGRSFHLTTLLGGVESRATPFVHGSFITLYLSPRDYHRIHMPLAGVLRQRIYIPGRLYPVNRPATRGVDGLFARNERVVLLFDTALGPMAMILVGALFVGSIETRWEGEITPPQRSVIEVKRFSSEQEIRVERGEEVGRFNMGSTVILLLGKDAIDLTALQPGSPLRMGQALAGC